MAIDRLPQQLRHQHGKPGQLVVGDIISIQFLGAWMRELL